MKWVIGIAELGCLEITAVKHICCCARGRKIYKKTTENCKKCIFMEKLFLPTVEISQSFEKKQVHTTRTTKMWQQMS